MLPSNAFQIFAEVLVTSADNKIKAEIIFIVGNIAAESTSLRDSVLESILPAAMGGVLRSSGDCNVNRNGAFTLTTLCMGLDPPPNIEKTGALIPTLAHLIESWDMEVVTNSCFALSYLCETSPSHIQRVIEAGACPRLVELLGSRGNMEVVSSAVYVLGKIANGNEAQTQVIIDCEALPALRRLLSLEHKEVVMDACWVISNIAAGNRQQIQALIDANIFPEVAKLLQSDACQVVKEAVWVIKQSLSTRRTSLEQVDYFLSLGIVDLLCSLLSMNCAETLVLVLHSLDKCVIFGVNFKLEEVSGELTLSLKDSLIAMAF